eukprot:gnl/MRDRNA2_/MRDRNA2_130296_c0_seq1.p1 gnl/MRDRNA2_/MRDRNA2_130296_c0~~gnl/MRDRNA2_/MRDRNA2_130296_c0_seq1.p1  ORF type:complete len:822 (+),score=149.54 gnl/MRDRNA2_/MRDRNA2_130296_c0_seq1:1-2466(+)
MDTERLSMDFDVICGEGKHYFWRNVSVLGFVLYGFGVPAFFYLILYKHRNKLLLLLIREKYGFLYNGFRMHYYNTQPLFMLRLFGIYLFATVPPITLRMVFMLIMSCIFITFHIYCNPFDNRDHCILYRLELLSLCCLSSIFLCRLVMDVREELRGMIIYDALQSSLAEGVFFGCMTMLHFSFWMLALWSVIQNSIIPKLHFRHEHSQVHLNPVQRLLIRLTARKSMYFDMDTQEIDVSELSRKELVYLCTVLCDTLECYIDSEVIHHPGRMNAAIQEAYLYCVHARLAKAADLRFFERHFSTLGKGVMKRAGGTVEGGKVNRKSEKDAHEAKGRQLTFSRKQVTHAVNDGVTVQELQNALILIWQGIVEMKDGYFPSAFSMGLGGEKEKIEAPKMIWTGTESLQAFLDGFKWQDDNNLDNRDESRSGTPENSPESNEKDPERTVMAWKSPQSSRSGSAIMDSIRGSPSQNSPPSPKRKSSRLGGWRSRKNSSPESEQSLPSESRTGYGQDLKQKADNWAREAQQKTLENIKETYLGDTDNLPELDKPEYEVLKQRYEHVLREVLTMRAEALELEALLGPVAEASPDSERQDEGFLKDHNKPPDIAFSDGDAQDHESDAVCLNGDGARDFDDSHGTGQDARVPEASGPLNSAVLSASSVSKGAQTAEAQNVQVSGSQRKTDLKKQVDDFVAASLKGQSCNWLPNSQATEWHEASFTLEEDCSILEVRPADDELMSMELVRIIFIEKHISETNLKSEEISDAVKRADQQRRLICVQYSSTNSNMRKLLLLRMASLEECERFHTCMNILVLYAQHVYGKPRLG